MDFDGKDYLWGEGSKKVLIGQVCKIDPWINGGGVSFALTFLCVHVEFL